MENVNENEIIPVIAEKIAKLSVGSFSEEPIELSGQFIFLGLHGIREARTLSLEEARESIEQILLEKKYQSLRQNWLDQLKRKAYCVII
jgi:parvulin-like peptidyl-prolyl isomerase